MPQFFAAERLLVSEMMAQMRAAGEDTNLTEAIAALSRPKVYETILDAVRERVETHEQQGEFQEP